MAGLDRRRVQSTVKQSENRSTPRETAAVPVPLPPRSSLSGLRPTCRDRQKGRRGRVLIAPDAPSHPPVVRTISRRSGTFRWPAQSANPATGSACGFTLPGRVRSESGVSTPLDALRAGNFPWCGSAIWRIGKIRLPNSSSPWLTTHKTPSIILRSPFRCEPGMCT